MKTFSASHPISQALVLTVLGALLLFVVDPAAAASTSTTADCPCLNATNTTSDGGDKDAEMRWEAWVTTVVIICLLVTLVLDFAPASSAMVLSGFILYLAQVVQREDLWVGFINNGVLSIALFYIIVAPIAQLPVTNKLIRVTMSGGSPGSYWWPLLKLTGVSLLLSSFFENTPQVAMFTPLVAKYCAENDLPVAQFLLPMDYATILGNFAVVGCSSTLVISGLMEDEGLGAMNFFELIKIGGPLIPFIMIYLVVAPKFLLPSNNKGSIGAASPAAGSPPVKKGDNDADDAEKKKAAAAKKKRNGKKHFILKVKISASSTLIGQKYRHLHEAIPGGRQDSIEVLKVVRGSQVIDLADYEAGSAPTPSENSTTDAVSPTTPEKVPRLFVEEGDIVWLSATPTTISSCTAVLNVDIITANNNQANQMIQYYADQQKPAEVDEATLVTAEEAVSNEPVAADVDTAAEKDTTVVEMKDKNNKDDSVEEKKEEEKKKAPKQILFDVILSPSNPSIDQPISAQDFQRRYHAPILAVRCSRNGHDVSPDELSSYILSAGDNLLILAESDFEKNVAPTQDFLMVGPLADIPYEKNPYVFVFPRWFPSCCGTLTGGTDPKTQKRVVIIPSAYQYLTLVIFVAIVIAAIFHISLSSLALGGVVLYVLLGFVSTSQAIKQIHWEVYVMVAFSFPLGAAVKRSGLADVIGQAISDGNLNGLPLLIVISFVTVAMTNLITNKATAQVMFPIVISIYKAIDADPIPAIMVVAMVAVFALCTPFAIPPNVIVLGPGGYTGMDYIKFGVPITLLLTILTPISAALVYDQW